MCKVAARLGYTTIMWTVDTIDWQRPAPEIVAERAMKRLAGGNIILVHPTEPTAKALPSIRPAYRSRVIALSLCQSCCAWESLPMTGDDARLGRIT